MIGIILVRLFYCGLTAAVFVVGANGWMNRNYILGGGCIVLGILMVAIPVVHAIKLRIAYRLYNRAVQNERKTSAWVYRTVFKNEDDKKRILEEEQNPLYVNGEQSGMESKDALPEGTGTMQTYRPEGNTMRKEG